MSWHEWRAASQVAKELNDVREILIEKQHHKFVDEPDEADEAYDDEKEVVEDDIKEIEPAEVELVNDNAETTEVEEEVEYVAKKRGRPKKT
jgi:hypothetical protein